MHPAEALRLLATRRPAASPKYNKYIPHDPHPKQELFLSLDAEEEVLYGGSAGSAKTDALLMAALRYVDCEGYNAIVFRRTHTELALPDAIMARSHEWLSSTDAHWSGDTKTWTFPVGSTLTFGYLDGPLDHLRYQGAAGAFVGFDELTQWATPRGYLYLFSRMRRVLGAKFPIRMRATCNPGGPGHEWVMERWGIPVDVDFAKVYRTEDRVFVPAHRRDNPSLDHEAYDRMLSKLDPVTREQLDRGRWVQDSSGLVYKYEKARNYTERLPTLQPGDSWRRVLGLDFGVVDECAYVQWAFCQHYPELYCEQSEKFPGLAPSEFGGIVQELENTWHYDRIVGDIGGMGKGFEAEWRSRFTIPMQAAQKTNKLGYIRLFNGDLSNGLVKLLPGNEAYADELKNLAWADEKRLKEHPAMPNHLCDAGLYGWREAKHWAFESYVAPKTRDAFEQAEVERLEIMHDEHERLRQFGL